MSTKRKPVHLNSGPSGAAQDRAPSEVYMHEEVMKAHQYLYYVTSSPVWSDYNYDLFCKKHGLDGNGGSDLASDYTDRVKVLARLFTDVPCLDFGE